MSDPISRDRALLIAFSTVAFGIVTLLRRLAVVRLHPMQFEIVSGFVHLCIIPFYIAFIMTHVVKVETWDTKGVVWAVVATIINMAAALMIMYALRSHNDVGLVGTLAGASPVITLMLSALILGEQPSFKSMIGIAFVLIGVFLASR